MSKLRTANLLGALAGEIADRIEREGKLHPNETSSATAALNVIGFYEGCSNGALSRALGLSHTATVRLVDKLELSGLVRSERGADKRAVALRLTRHGRERARAVIHDRCLRLGDLIEVLTPRQRRQLDDIAEALLKSMVKAAQDADHICRLCDGAACPTRQCPVHQKAVALETA
ncbi:MAG TPA: MarR family transcriptional regulator [Bradyrhizobium sp.]|jgi:MarR family transcriptional repressor of emrRAB|uniref:MarR family winged helix-turn-helix transcriptional regulator n=1 Tax=Bradyrhizobium sp. TaxID=376 RepID=UPI002CC3E20E|nr:MarR family transcriptional regulator [Bradyrhizobium sp.]HXB80902.1 MarR family transcriptional regulator [Bradyrhizobium sp.]